MQIINPCDANTCYGNIGATCNTEDFTLEANDLVIGDTYQLVIDGCNGNICDFSIHANGIINGTDADGDGYDDEEDCDDTNPDINPGAIELCDGIDNNCDGVVDDGVTLVTFYTDFDLDGYGAGDAIVDCIIPAEASLLSGDCDDEDPNINPGAADVDMNGIDENCDGVDGVSSVEETDELVVRIFPNPVSNELFVETQMLNLRYQMEFIFLRFTIYRTRILQR